MGATQAGTKQEVRGGLSPWQIRKVTSHVEAHLGRPIRNDDLASLVRLNPSHFGRAFRNSFGEPPHEYVIRRRVERAQGLMLSTDAPLSEIALDCGLADQSHLTRLFRRIAGESPRAWRRARSRRAYSTVRIGAPAFLMNTTRNFAGSRLARVAADDVHVVRSFVEALSGLQGHFFAALDLHDDGPFEHVDERVRIVAMDRIDGAGRIVDRDHVRFLAGKFRQSLRHERRYYCMHVVCGSGEGAAGDHDSRYESLEERHCGVLGRENDSSRWDCGLRRQRVA